MGHRVTLIPGDGTGPELAPHVQRIVQAAGVSIEWDIQLAGSRALEEHGDPLPDRVLDSIRSTRVALRGRIGTPVGTGSYVSPTVRIRQGLDLYAGVRPIRNLPGLKARYSGLDIVLIRELTEDVYTGIEHEVVPEVVQSLKVTTEAASRRIVRFALEYARACGRKRVTLVHKANIMKMSDGLFLASGRAVAAEYPDIRFDAIIVDNCAMQLVLRPHQFDVMVLGNLFGDLLSDLGAGLAGGISAVWGANRGDDIVVFEAIHGLAPQVQGRGLANPLPFLMPALALLRHLGETDAEARILGAIQSVLEEGRHVTPDLGGTASTAKMVEAMLRRI